MANFYTDNEDLLFYMRDGVDWASLVEITEYGFRTAEGYKDVKEALASYHEIAEMVGDLIGNELAPRAAKIDAEHPSVKDGEVVEGRAMRDIFKKMREAELHRLCLPRELGGLNAPLMVYFLCGEMIARADVSSMTHFSFHGGMGLAMLAFSIHEGTTRFDTKQAQIAQTRFEKEIEEIASGKAWGCMDITEPDAGSDMAKLRARAEQDAEGNWYITGQKIFITSGHGKYHFVIARTEPAAREEDTFAGLKGLSMFLVKAYEDLPGGKRERYVTIERVEEKLGHNGSVTAALSFERTPAALIGKRGEGFRYMLTLMNNARVGVGFESIGLMEAAYRMACAYAEERHSMGKAIGRHEMIADYLDEMKTDLQAIRALCVTAAYHEEMSQKLRLLERFGEEMSESERQRVRKDQPRHQRMARRLTPLLKYIAAEKAVDHARRAVQIHGGVGYTREYGAEKLLRDAMVLPIYEGTSQIQSLMAMKDTLTGILQHPREFVTRQAKARLQSISAEDTLVRRVAKIQVLSLSAQQHLMTRTIFAKLKQLPEKPFSAWFETLSKDWDPKRDFAMAMLHAERLTRILTDEAICEVLLEQSQKHTQRRALLSAWLDRAETRCRGLYDEIVSLGEDHLARLQGQDREAQ
ncbi:acyl-CoA dehydrogenase family protein [Myxococcota bacterium]|nr:acyl-CoA dehydrogenase family protein [Myxococcota bacterium]